jgi:hypothetical protein
MEGCIVTQLLIFSKKDGTSGEKKRVFGSMMDEDCQQT